MILVQAGTVRAQKRHNYPHDKKEGAGSKRLTPCYLCYLFMVPGAGIEPAQPQGPRDFKSLASTSSATQAMYYVLVIPEIMQPLSV